MKYLPPTITLEAIQALPVAERERVLKVYLQIARIACEKIGFIIVGQNAVVMNEAPSEVRVPRGTRISTISDAENVLNNLGVSISETPRVNVACKDLIIECIKATGGANISELKEYVMNRVSVSDNSIRDSLWRLHRAGFVKKGEGRKPKYTLGRNMS